MMIRLGGMEGHGLLMAEMFVAGQGLVQCEVLHPGDAEAVGDAGVGERGGDEVGACAGGTRAAWRRGAGCAPRRAAGADHVARSL